MRRNARPPAARRGVRASRRSRRCASIWPQRGQAGRHRQRVARERAGLVHRPVGRDVRHQVGAAAVRADRQPAADDLAERRQVRRARRSAPARRRGPGGNRSSLRRGSAPHPRGCRDPAGLRGTPGAGRRRPCCRPPARRSAAAIARGCASNRRVTPARSLKAAISVSRAVPSVTPALSGTPKRGGARSRLDQERVPVAVIAALELHDRRSPGGAAGQADGAPSWPRCRSSPSAPARATARGRSALRPSPLRAWTGAPNDAPRVIWLRIAVHDRRVAVAEDHRAPRADVVEVAPAVLVFHPWRRWARAMNSGVPPTPRNARTGEFTPPGISAPGPSEERRRSPVPADVEGSRHDGRSDGRRSGQRSRGRLREVGEDDVRAGPADAGQRLQHDPRLVDPAVARRRP